MEKYYDDIDDEGNIFKYQNDDEESIYDYQEIDGNIYDYQDEDEPKELDFSHGLDIY